MSEQIEEVKIGVGRQEIHLLDFFARNWQFPKENCQLRVLSVHCVGSNFQNKNSLQINEEKMEKKEQMECRRTTQCSRLIFKMNKGLRNS
uniref:Uncharacterized protein n=1 Tax=Haemonchus contortus TaxID=6289 RepID=A0A7I4YUA4_HAECO